MLVTFEEMMRILRTASPKMPIIRPNSRGFLCGDVKNVFSNNAVNLYIVNENSIVYKIYLNWEFNKAT